MQRLTPIPQRAPKCKKALKHCKQTLPDSAKGANYNSSRRLTLQTHAAGGHTCAQLRNIDSCELFHQTQEQISHPRRAIWAKISFRLGSAPVVGPDLAPVDNSATRIVILAHQSQSDFSSIVTSHHLPVHMINSPVASLSRTESLPRILLYKWWVARLKRIL